MVTAMAILSTAKQPASQLGPLMSAPSQAVRNGRPGQAARGALCGGLLAAHIGKG